MRADCESASDFPVHCAVRAVDAATELAQRLQLNFEEVDFVLNQASKYEQV